MSLKLSQVTTQRQKSYESHLSSTLMRVKLVTPLNAWYLDSCHNFCLDFETLDFDFELYIVPECSQMFLKVPEGSRSMKIHEVSCRFQIHELACSYVSLHAVT